MESSWRSTDDVLGMGECEAKSESNFFGSKIFSEAQALCKASITLFDSLPKRMLGHCKISNSISSSNRPFLWFMAWENVYLVGTMSKNLFASLTINLNNRISSLEGRITANVFRVERRKSKTCCSKQRRINYASENIWEEKGLTIKLLSFIRSLFVSSFWRKSDELSSKRSLTSRILKIWISVSGWSPNNWSSCWKSKSVSAKIGDCSELSES